jgi:transposase InsO family protein
VRKSQVLLALAVSLSMVSVYPRVAVSQTAWDHAVIESFNATIETELIHRVKWATREEARAAIYKDIETWYNTERLHSTLGYRSPCEFEALDLRKIA